MARLSEGKMLLIVSIVGILAGLLASLWQEPSTSLMVGVIFAAVTSVIIVNW